MGLAIYKSAGGGRKAIDGGRIAQTRCHFMSSLTILLPTPAPYPLSSAAAVHPGGICHEHVTCERADTSALTVAWPRFAEGINLLLPLMSFNEHDVEHKKVQWQPFNQ